MSGKKPAPPWSLLAVLLIGTFIGTLGNSMVSLALPTLKDTFSVPLTSIVWSITLYTLTFSVLMPVFGTLGPAIGYKRMYTGGISLVCLGSIASAFATSFPVFLAARILTGIGVGTVLPSVMGMIANRFPLESQGQATGYWALVNTFGHAVGPMLGGFFLRYTGWQAIFLFNIPLGILSILLAIKLLPRDERKKAVEFDFPGAIAVTVLAICAMVAISQTAKNGIASVVTVALWVGVILPLIFIITFERRTAAPFVNTVLFRNRKFISAVISISMQAFSQFGLLVSVPVFLIDIHGMENQLAGLMILSMTLTMAVLSPISGRLADRFGSKGVCSTGAALVAAGAIYFFFLKNLAFDGWNWAFILLGLFIFGLGFGLVQSSATVAVIQAVHPSETGVATGFFHMIRFIVASLGSTVFGILLETNQQGLSNGFFASFWVIFAAAAHCAAIYPVASIERRKTGTVRYSGAIPGNPRAIRNTRLP